LDVVVAAVDFLKVFGRFDRRSFRLLRGGDVCVGLLKKGGVKGLNEKKEEIR
jgi:hypothetical protein